MDKETKAPLPEMLPCPFCGSFPYLEHRKSAPGREPNMWGEYKDTPEMWSVRCYGPTKSVHTDKHSIVACNSYKSEQEAIAKWNTRTLPAAPVAEGAVEALAFILADPEQVELDDQEAKRVIRKLAAAGYTLRRETMTEAELERELMDKSFSVVGGRIIGVDTARELAKKYRG